MVSLKRQQACGWLACVASTAIAGFWAVWGAIETFHEGWYFASFWRNVALMLGQYLLPMFVFVVIGAVSVRWPRLGGVLHLGAAAFAAWFFGVNHSVPLLFIVTPLALLAVLHWLGRAEPRKWALRLVAGLPLLIALGCMVEPVWRVSGRVNDWNFGARLVTGNGVTLIWAPAGPGWPLNLDHARETGMMHWQKARERCQYLNTGGTALADAPQNIWRLPTVEEAVRSAA
jgi:hypothetical protein